MDSTVKRDVWVDNVKVVACVLVVLGHFYKSMVKADLLSDSAFYNWFNYTIYYFHVPLFFICSGYLYQKYSRIDSLNAWGINILKKLVALGIPYIVFSTITWLLKKGFSDSVNSQLGGLGDTLLLHPASPYWYLYVLFFLFVITPTTRNSRKQILLFTMTAVLRILYSFGVTDPVKGIYLIDKILANWIWFVFGMTISYNLVKFCNAAIGTMLFAVFLIGSVLVEMGYIGRGLSGLILAALACYSVISIVYSFFKDGVQNKYWLFCAKYTMPVFLMHTLFAAPFRSVLLKIGINNAFVHVVIGLIVSFCGPIVAMTIMDKLRPLDFLVYPTRYIKIGKRS